MRGGYRIDLSNWQCPHWRQCDGVVQVTADVVITVVVQAAEPGRNVRVFVVVGVCVVVVGGGQLLAAVQIQQQVGLDERHARARVARVAVVLAQGEAVQEDVRVRVQARAARSSHFSNWPGPSSGRNWEASKEGTVGYGVGNAVG